MLIQTATIPSDSYTDIIGARYHFHCLITFQFVSSIGYCLVYDSVDPLTQIYRYNIQTITIFSYGNTFTSQEDAGVEKS